ncbi:MAG: NADH-quinone oxidoreductase subunit N [candidate division BRC1 bacterium ADurb.BinA364]|nr:MAG: NADH-quinone oxidoreductase subunit N [candidate division BRC1 bacterium ADurb.BinA364]
MPAPPLAFLVALAMVLAGIGFKIAAVPFHTWAPDVYQGAPTPVTTMLAVISKSAGFAILLRLIHQSGTTLGGGASFARAYAQLGLDSLFWILAVATMTLGNLAALRQTNIKRILAYSSIAHAGYLLMAFAVANEQAWEATLFYLAVYYLMTLGAFFVAQTLENHTGSVEIADCRGLWTTCPLLVAAMTVFMVSLTGLPPTAGFIGKFKLFKVLVDAGLGESVRQPGFYFSLAIIGVLNSAISLYYYFKIVRAMALEQYETAPSVPLLRPEAIGVALLLAAVLIFGIFPQAIQEFTSISFMLANAANPLVP